MPPKQAPFRVVFYSPARFELPPGQAYLLSIPEKVRARFLALLVAVAAAPPYRFRGGGTWEAMHGAMTGWFEVRINSAHKYHYRLFCIVDTEALNYQENLLVVVDGRTKRYLTTLPDSEYKKIKRLGEEYFSSNPREI